MNTKYVKTTIDEIEPMRNHRLTQLPYPQALHLEWLVVRGDCFWILEDHPAAAQALGAADNETADSKTAGSKTPACRQENTPGRPHGAAEPMGYFITSEDNILMELYIFPLWQPYLQELFHNLVRDQRLQAVLAQSFDGLIMKCCLGKQYPSEISGLVFNHFIDTPFPSKSPFTRRLATEADWDFLLSQKEELYESEEELAHMIENSHIHMYFTEDTFVGCGYLIRIRPDRSWYDIGMWVAPPHRGKGIASFIIADLKAHCLRSDFTVVCACAADNAASKKTLEKNGFRTLHDLLLFKITGGD